MSMLTPLLAQGDLLFAFPPDALRPLVTLLEGVSLMKVYADSMAAKSGLLYFLARRGREKSLCLVGGEDAAAADFHGEERRAEIEGAVFKLKVCPLNHATAMALRRHLPYAAPVLMGTKAAFGFGDRLGLATPGHALAVRGSGLVPFFAQQSAREMARTGRTPEEVLDCASWGVFQSGYREGFGADADHLKTTADIDATAAAGFTLYTIDPGDQVDSSADTDSLSVLADKFDSLPWENLETTAADLRKVYLSRAFSLSGELHIAFTEEMLLRAAVKYGHAVAHTAAMYRHLVSRGIPFELEVAVDETATPTSRSEHLFVAHELRRLGVVWVGLAPRFVGRFEKGVDYIGDLDEFEATCHGHALIARRFGDYKLSLHSGSDKFRIYSSFSRIAGARVHIKTAGTSYLEALRVIASIEPALFREILDFARARYEQDRASYHVSAEPAKVPAAASLTDAELPGLLEEFNAREVLHVTFGSVLTAMTGAEERFRGRLIETLQNQEAAHYAALQAHFTRHLAPFKTSTA